MSPANGACPTWWAGNLSWSTRLEKLENRPFLILDSGKTGKQHTFSPYGLEKLDKEKWPNDSLDFLFVVN